jgi:hypothetical protein
MASYQRMGAVSNSHVGRDFEIRVRRILESRGIRTEFDHRIAVGLRGRKKEHRFDLGSESPKVIVECKCQTWTMSGGTPSAKLKNWAEAMFYFHLAPPDYRKIFVVERSLRPRDSQSLLTYFMRTQDHLIPDGIEFWEVERHSDDVRIFDCLPDR